MYVDMNYTKLNNLVNSLNTWVKKGKSKKYLTKEEIVMLLNGISYPVREEGYVLLNGRNIPSRYINVSKEGKLKELSWWRKILLAIFKV